MIVGKVTGMVIATQKDEGLEGFKLLVVQNADLATMEIKDSYLVAVDTVGAGVGEYVMTVGGSSARIASGLKDRPVDCAIVAIIDAVDIEGRTVYSKRTAVGG